MCPNFEFELPKQSNGRESLCLECSSGSMVQFSLREFKLQRHSIKHKEREREREREREKERERERERERVTTKLNEGEGVTATKGKGKSD